MGKNEAFIWSKESSEFCGSMTGVDANKKSFVYGGYRYYLLYDSITMTWSSGQRSCLGRGGDLAYHHMENLNFRRDLFSAFGLRDSDPESYHWIHVGFNNKGSGIWKDLNGTNLQSEDIHWMSGQPSPGNKQTAVVFSLLDHPNDLLTMACNTKRNRNAYVICEFECVLQ